LGATTWDSLTLRERKLGMQELWQAKRSEYKEKEIMEKDAG
jgi:hypothetical protein